MSSRIIQIVIACLAIAVIGVGIFVMTAGDTSQSAERTPVGTAAETPPPWDGGDIARGSEPPAVPRSVPPRTTTQPRTAAPPPEPVIIAPAPVIVAEPVIIEATDERDYATVLVNFATNRVMDADADIPDRFTGLVGDLVYGDALVAIPRDHEAGVLESQNWLMSFIVAPNPESHVLVETLDVRPTAEILAQINAQASTGNGAVLVYVHGYNTSFDKAARRMGQMTYDLGWDGAAFFYSWPSRAQAGLYFTDDTAADQSIRVMKQVLGDLGSLPDSPDIILIAHSMGTRVLSEALQQLVTEGTPVTNRISTLILAAPDIDKQVFVNDIAPRLDAMEQAAITLYASSEDSALKASRAARGFTRMGDSSDGLILVDGIEIVDATGAESDFFGHTYFGDNATIIDDIFDVVHNRLPADERPMLVPRDHPDGTYWAIAVP
ncbi:alpha/beta hydrolase [Yoonia sp. 208BN28-4]|uniref:alpha/beta hydrolase n=1 Tax=Yoonia sp. 208BN28-4 TaxID=3126505 RepID=UPI0030A426A0